MNSQKVENLLNLSLDSTVEEREKSQILEVGFDREDRTWEVIVKFHGDIQKLADDTVKVQILLNGYAIITIPESLLESLSKVEEIEYIEKPKNLIYAVYEAKRNSCIIPLTIGDNSLSGRGILVAVIDSGIDYFLSDFQNQTGSRILYLWDQTQTADAKKGWYPPTGFSIGVEYRKEQIDEAISTGDRISAREIVPQTDISGHGTAVAGIAAQSSSSQLYRGIAPESELIIVKLGIPREEGFPRTTELMRAISYVLQKSTDLERPVAINLSFGNTYGPHDGTSLLERFMDNASEVGRNVICVGSGNEAATGGHTSSRLETIQNVELAVGEFEQSINVQLWKNYTDVFSITLIAPNGDRYEVNQGLPGRQTFRVLNTQILIYIGMPTPYSVNQEIFFDFIPTDTYINAGVWTFVLSPVKIVNGIYQMYLPSAATRSADTRFFTPNPELTLTIPSTSSKVITVGAYNSLFNSYADFSGRGAEFTRESILVANPGVKPDIVAPGVGIQASVPGGGYETLTGTSFATPVVTGSAALLMQWGISNGNDNYLYGEKVKAYLISGARPLPGYREYPNPQVGWGALCVGDSLPV